MGFRRSGVIRRLAALGGRAGRAAENCLQVIVHGGRGGVRRRLGFSLRGCGAFREAVCSHRSLF